jgi:hypothetical protein
MNVNNVLRNPAQRPDARRIGGVVLVLLLALLVAGWWLQPSAEAEGARAAASLATIDASPVPKCCQMRHAARATRACRCGGCPEAPCRSIRGEGVARTGRLLE